MPRAFISYRRRDSSAAARWLTDIIRRAFGPQAAFIDTEEIRVGYDWRREIDAALAASKVVMPVIGAHWLKLTDDFGRRRLDNPDDWVRREIAYALERGLNVIPILISGTTLPPAEGLPDALKSLGNFQARSLRDETWSSDLSLLLGDLEGLGFALLEDPTVKYPAPKITLRELSPERLEQCLKELPGWTITTSDLPGRPPLKRVELTRVYELGSFKSAIDFMSAASQPAEAMQHHPRWENIWRTVRVWLSTWDIGHRPSTLDLDLAREMEAIYVRTTAGLR